MPNTQAATPAKTPIQQMIPARRSDVGIGVTFPANATMIRVGGVRLAREQRRLAAIITADVVGYPRAAYEQICYSSLVPRTYLCVRLLEPLD
jgi:hypothetical protein